MITEHEEYAMLEFLKINSMFNESIGATISFASKQQISFMLGFNSKKIDNILKTLQKNGKIANNDGMIIIKNEV